MKNKASNHFFMGRNWLLQKTVLSHTFVGLFHGPHFSRIAPFWSGDQMDRQSVIGSTKKSMQRKSRISVSSREFVMDQCEKTRLF